MLHVFPTVSSHKGDDYNSLFGFRNGVQNDIDFVRCLSEMYNFGRTAPAQPERPHPHISRGAILYDQAENLPLFFEQKNSRHSQMDNVFGHNQNAGKGARSI
jgi:hypothetical protein